ncbi:MAG: motif [Pseudomonadota bacterium]|jgi:hypothetical protein
MWLKERILRDGRGVAALVLLLAAGAAQADPPTIVKSYNPIEVVEGGITTLIFTLANHTGPDSTGISISGPLSAGLGFADDNSTVVTTTCGGTAVVNAGPGQPSLMVTGMSLATGATCTVSFPVKTYHAMQADAATPTLTSSTGDRPSNFIPGPALTVRAAPVAPSPASPQSVPTLGEWGMIGLAGLLALLGARRLRRV